MRTESSTSSASAATRVRGEMERARRWVSTRGRPTRLALAGLAAAALIGLAYWAIPTEHDDVVWLYDGRTFSRDTVLGMQKALAAEKIAFKADATNRIGVLPTKWPDALDALKKHAAEPPSLEDIEKEPPVVDILASPADRSELQRWRMERKLKAIIERYENIRSADVSITRNTIKGVGMRPLVQVTGVVTIDAVPRPTHRVISSIQTLLSAYVPDLRPDAVTISDRQGHFYLKAGDPTAASVTQSLARGEELRDAILENLGPLIAGVDVVVQVEPPALAEPTPPTQAGRSGKPADAQPTPAPAPAPAADAMKMNVPIALEPEAEPLNPANGLPPHEEHNPRAGQVLALPALPTVGKANIWIKVPRSYYLKTYRENFPSKNPSREDLAPYADKTRELVENACMVLVPTAERGRVLLSTILDDLGTTTPLVVASGAAETERSWPVWAPAVALGAGVGVAVSLAMMAGFGLIASRRPEALPARTRVRSGLSVDAPSGPVPGPSERVRDLVRRDPEAAAGVLQRWIGQGEGGPGG